MRDLTVVSKSERVIRGRWSLFPPPNSGNRCGYLRVWGVAMKR
ncbi:hypothetical protein [Ignatzschineria sp. F8392]|nr:hypothetical protein [Ignatzschineria sp. F8392]